MSVPSKWWMLIGLLTPGVAAALDLTEAVEAGLANHPAVAGAQAGEKVALADRAAAGKAMRPILRTEAGVQLWAQKQVLNLGGSSGNVALPPPTTPYENVVAGLVGSLGQPTTVRELVTANVRVQVIQPLTDLWRISVASDIAEEEVGSARLQTASARRQVSAGVAEAYLRVIQAKSLAATADAGVKALLAREETAKALVEGGLMSHTDQLKIEVARRAAEQDVLAATNAMATARAALGMAMGRPLPEDAPIDEVEPSWAAEPVPPLNAAFEQAVTNDPALLRSEVQVRQADSAVDIARSARLPTVNLIGQYEHIEGSQLQQANSLFVGANLSWNVFEWGASGDRLDAAAARTHAARTQVTARQQQLRFTVEKAWLDHRTAVGQVSVAEAALVPAAAYAEDQRARLDASRATVSDVIDAEVALTQAQARLEAARSERLIALVKLRQAQGLPLVEGNR